MPLNDWLIITSQNRTHVNKKQLQLSGDELNKNDEGSIGNSSSMPGAIRNAKCKRGNARNDVVARVVRTS